MVDTPNAATDPVHGLCVQLLNPQNMLAGAAKDALGRTPEKDFEYHKELYDHSLKVGHTIRRWFIFGATQFKQLTLHCPRHIAAFTLFHSAATTILKLVAKGAKQRFEKTLATDLFFLFFLVMHSANAVALLLNPAGGNFVRENTFCRLSFARRTATRCFDGFFQDEGTSGFTSNMSRGGRRLSWLFVGLMWLPCAASSSTPEQTPRSKWRATGCRWRWRPSASLDLSRA